MLKNKKAIYILIPLNILIWSFFAYRIFHAFAEDETPVPAPVAVSGKTERLQDKGEYTLSLDYKDPFLKGSKQEYHPGPLITSAQPKKAAPVVKAIPPPPKQVPDIKYLGLIRNNSSGLSTALISVNGQSRLIKPNDSFDGIVFKSFNKDSLVAKWGKERIVARK